MKQSIQPKEGNYFAPDFETVALIQGPICGSEQGGTPGNYNSDDDIIYTNPF